MESKSTQLVDRSRIDCRLLCKMKRYWQYDFLGKGIVKIPRPSKIDPRTIGTAVHAGMEVLLQGRGVAEAIRISAAFYDSAELQLKYLVSGIILGWAHERLPLLLEQYDVVETETQHNVDFGGLIIPLRRDALLRRKSDKQLVVLDFKTLSYYSAGWDDLHQHSLQTLQYTLGTEILSGERCAGVQYEGLVKGTFNHIDQEFNSPYCVLYTDGKEFTPTRTVRKSFKKEGVWKYFSPENWMDVLLKEESYQKLFQVVPPSRPPSHVLTNIMGQVVENELLHRRYLTLNDGDKFRYLEMNPGACYKYGSNYPCEFFDLCFSGTDAKDVTEIPEGYQERTPHHEDE